jgi:signal transduction histidine kinase
MRFEPTLGVAVAPFAGHTNGATAATPQNTKVGRLEEIAIICHELRNSLAVVSSAAALLRSPPGSVMDTARTLISRHVGHMSQHIDDLLRPARSHDSGRALQLSRIDLRVIAQYAIDAIGPELTRRGQHLAVTLPAAAIWAQADGPRLEQAFSNLLLNAAKYTPNGGDISMSMERDGALVRVSIRDSGIGLETAMLSRVFEMFVQVNPSLYDTASGFGIGLAVVRSLVEQHGGTVNAASAGLGSGSEFTILLPTLSR